MKHKTHKRMKVIRTDDALTFETQVNKILEQFPEAEIEYNHNLGFCAYLTYTFEEEIPEDVADRFHQQGIYYHCRNCPHMEPPRDGRCKWCECDITPYGKTHMDSEACEYFYKSLLTGEIKRSELIKD